MTDVAQWLGHASPEITHEYYGHLMPDAPDRGRAVIDSAMAPLATVTGIGSSTRRRSGAGNCRDYAQTRPVAA
ncbi:hypothetical protein AB0F72_10900 [Actinoplanes sp. NPDC023936]|uniref:hypothetical protein n=1 Tax=Actinoplanes sp. NPDC023936 TaxID=3154910 RepID=UPI0033FB7E0C